MESRGNLKLSTMSHVGEGGFVKKKSEKSIRSFGIHVMSLTHIEFTVKILSNVRASTHDRVWFPLSNLRFTETSRCFFFISQSVPICRWFPHCVVAAAVCVCSFSWLLCHILINTSQLSECGSFPFYWIHSRGAFTHEYKNKWYTKHTQKYDNFRIYEGCY